MRVWRNVRTGLAAGLMALALSGAQGAPPARKAPATKPAAQQQPAPEANVIRRLEVTGNQRFTNEQVLGLSGLKTGMTPTQALFEASRDRLLDAGVFESVGWRYDPDPAGGFVATLEVHEIDQFLPWLIERIPVTPAEFAAAAAKKLPLFGPEIPTTERSIDRSAGIIEELARPKGFSDQVVGKVGIVGKDKVMVVFQPKTPAPKVARMLVTGSRVVPKADLQKAMNDIAIGTPFTDTNMQFLFENQAKPIFEAYGRLKAKALKFTSEPAQGAVGVVVTMEVDEGPEYTLAGVEVLGTPFAARELEEEGQWPIGKSANYSLIGTGLNKITAKLRKQGYLKSKYQGQRKMDDAKNEVWLVLNYDIGERYSVGRLTIKGLDLESEPVIRKMYKAKPGEPFDPDYPDEFLKDVRARGMFDFLGETKAEVKLDEQENRADVTLIFKGEAVPEKKKQPF